MENVIFTQADHLILQSYASSLEGLAAYLGDEYEFVLYSLEDMERSVVKIVNGHYTGRGVSAPLSKIAQTILDRFLEDGGQEYSLYSTTDKSGKQIRFTSIAIRGEGNRIIGLLCINSYLHTPQQDVLTNFFENPDVVSHYSPKDAGSAGDAILDTTLQIKQSVESDGTILPSLKNKEIVTRLEAQGIFHLKNAVVRVAEILGISRNTVYMHLRNLRLHT